MNTQPEAAIMKEVLIEEFHVPVQWVEEKSHNTLENARFSFDILKGAGITRVYIVTHALHMPRSIRAFEMAGFQVVPAPTGFTTRCRTSVLDYLPNAYALVGSAEALREWIGRLWYALLR
jgi:uncharacterized SAM-binding protein YcdF (DUF218 family)